MIKRLACLFFSAVLAFVLAVPVSAAYYYPWYRWNDWFDKDGGYTGTLNNKYRFDVGRSSLVFAREAEEFNARYRELYAGSDIYVPLAIHDPKASPTQTTATSTQMLATEKNVKDDQVELSYKVLEGEEYVDAVTLVSTKKEKITGLLDALSVKIELANNYLPLTRSRVSVRLVLSVNGVSYQETAVTFRCHIVNREEYIRRNSVYGALTPAQFHDIDYSGEATFDFGDKIRYSGRVAPRYKYYLNLDKTPDPSLAEMYPDAYIEHYNFLGENDRFVSTGKLEIPIDETKFIVKPANQTNNRNNRNNRNNAAATEKKQQPTVYIYTLKGGQLKAVSMNTVTYKRPPMNVTIQTDRLEHYVFSNTPLLKTVDDNQLNILRSVYADDPSAANEEPSTAG